MAYTANLNVMNQTKFELSNVLLCHISTQGLVGEIAFAGNVPAGASASGNQLHFGPGSNDYWVLFFQSADPSLPAIQVMAPTSASLNAGDNGQTINVAIEADEVRFLIPGGADANADYLPGYQQSFLYDSNEKVGKNARNTSAPVSIVNQLGTDLAQLSLYHIWPEGSIIESLVFNQPLKAGATLQAAPAQSGSGGFDWFVMFCDATTASGCPVTFAMNPTNSQITGSNASISLIIEVDGEVAFINSPNPHSSGTFLPMYQQVFLNPQPSATTKVA